MKAVALRSKNAVRKIDELSTRIDLVEVAKGLRVVLSMKVPLSF